MVESLFVSDAGSSTGINNKSAEGDRARNENTATQTKYNRSTNALTYDSSARVNNGTTGNSAPSYLFRSAEGLLNLDSNLAHTQYHSAREPEGANFSASYISNSNSDSISYNRHRTTPIEKRFSLRSNSSSNDSLNEYHNSSSDYNNSKPNQNNHRSKQTSWLYRWQKSFERQANGIARSLARSIEMATKQYYFLLLGFSLIIIACLLASIVISRSVGIEPEVDGSSSESLASASHLGRLNSQAPVVEYEQRAIDVVDLIECGKTFAYTKVNLIVRVPKSSPIYRQRPSFLHTRQLNGEHTMRPEDKDSSAGSGKQIRFAMISPNEPEADIESVEEPTTTTTTTTGASTYVTENMIANTTTSGLFDELKPVVPASNGPLPKELSTLLNVTTTTVSDSDETILASELINDSNTDPDPLIELESELSLSSNPIKKKLIDCFIVDTDKRYNQRVILEDRHRNLASTRRVSLHKMMETIVDCRQLTWSSLPNLLSIKPTPMNSKSTTIQAASTRNDVVVNRTGEIVVIKEAEEQPDQTHNIFGSIFEDWLKGSKQLSPTDQSPSKKSSRDIAAEGSSRKERQVVNNDSENRSQVDQSSYFNMGLSMMSGIVPNTLWCGLGDRAANYSELGVEYKVDSCCRAHDHCPIRIKPFAADYGLINWSMSTRSHCDCDIDFDGCLKSVNSTLSNVIRNLYFRFVGLQCIDVEGKKFKN